MGPAFTACFEAVVPESAPARALSISWNPLLLKALLQLQALFAWQFICAVCLAVYLWQFILAWQFIFFEEMQKGAARQAVISQLDVGVLRHFFRWILFFFFGGFALAGHISIPMAEFGGQSIDPDGDGVPEIHGTRYDFESDRFYFFVAVGYTGDNPIGHASIGGKSFAGVATLSALSRDELRSSPELATTFHPPIVFAREAKYPFVGGFYGLSEEHPIVAVWMFGASGFGDEPFQLIALILDATEYFNGDPDPEIHIYHHHQGPVSAGDPPFEITFESTGFPMNLDQELDATTEFLAPRRLCYEIAETRSGWTYSIRRQGADGARETVATVTGTGDPMIVEWDDTSRNARAAFFQLVEESEAEVRPGF